MKKQTLSIILLVVSLASFAQDIPLYEKPHEVSRASKKGYLGQVVPNNSTGTFDMIYVLKSTARKVKTEIYTFDKELNLVNTQREDEDVERVRTKYKWFTFRGEQVKFNMTSVSASFRGELTLKRKEITQSWNWWYGFYRNSVKMLEKIKGEDEAGHKYGFLGGLYENYVSGKTLALAPYKESKISAGYSNYNIVSIDGELQITKTDELKLPGLYRPAYSQPLHDQLAATNEDLPRDWVTVLAPVEVKGESGASTTAYVYLRVSPEGKILEKVNIDSPTNGWRILDIKEANGKVVIVGSGIEKKKLDSKYFNDVFPTGTVSTTSLTENEKAVANDTKGTGAAKLLGGAGAASMLGMMKQMTNAETAALTQEALDGTLNELKYDHFIVATIQNGTYKTGSYADIEDFENVKQKPSNQKKYLLFDGKKFVIDMINIEKDGSLNITGQDIDTKKDIGRVYGEAYCFKYSPDYKLLANYGVEIEQKNKSRRFFNGDGPSSDQYPTQNMFYQSADGSKSYWIMKKTKAIRQDSDIDYDNNYFTGVSTTTITTQYTPLRAIQYGSIDNKSLKISDMHDLGEDEKKAFYLFHSHNSVQLNNYLIFLSETKKGDKLLLSRLDMSK
jgi:hypothetical protein